MKTLNNIRFLIISIGILLAITLFNSCKKDTPAVTKTIIEHDTVQHAWQAEPEFNNRDQYVSTVFVANGKAFFYGMQYYYYVYDSISNGWSIGFAPNPTSSRPAVNKDFFATADLNDSNFGLQSYASSSIAPSYVTTFKYFDTSFISSPFCYYFSPLCNQIDISDSNRVIFPVNTTDNSKCYFYLMDVKFSLNSAPSFTVNNFAKISLGYFHFNSQSRVNTVHLKNRFFIGIGDTTYLIREDYSIKPVMTNFQPFLSIFTYNGNYYTTAMNNYNGLIYETTDNGETWTLQYTLNNRGTVLINFDGKLIAIYNDQFWLVTLSPTSINFKELVNDGLTGKTITGLVKCNNKVWITTNGGVFYRAYSNFYQYK